MTVKTHPRRLMEVSLFALLAVAFIGFFVGVRPRPDIEHLTHEDMHAHAESGGSGALPARTNQELSIRPWMQAGAEWRPSVLESVIAVTTADPVAKRAALSEREKHRAYEGAPPTIPHPVGQKSAVECRACHEQGAAIGSAIAPPFSHALLPNCTQCHVPEQSPIPAKDRYGMRAVSSSFDGLRAAPAPYRWSQGPPQIPHTTHMRERCVSCHGPMGTPGLMCSHTERQSCMQCHAPSAAVEQKE